MKQLVLLFLATALWCTTPIKSAEVTYTFSGGRFGDNLVAYAHAKWISYHYQMPLLYKKFPYSDYLVMHSAEKRYSAKRTHKKNAYQLGKKILQPTDKGQNALYIVPYFPESSYEQKITRFSSKNDWPFFHVNWEDEGFKQELKRMISPKESVPQLHLPKDRLTIAVHARKGGGIDGPNHHLIEPLRLPPNSYFIEQIKAIYLLSNKKPLYVYLFTDDLNPQQIVDDFKNNLQGINVQISYRKDGRHHKKAVIDDFFSMLQFDCLIRSESNFSFMASKIGDYKVVINPLLFTWVGCKPHISKVNIHIREPL